LRGNLEITDVSFIFHLPNLEKLNFKGMFLESFPQRPDPSFVAPALRNLNLSENKLESLPDQLFSSFPNLVEIFLFGNKLKSIENLGWEHLTRVTKIDVSGNEITALPDSICGLQKLEIVRLFICFLKLDKICYKKIFLTLIFVIVNLLAICRV